MSEKQALVIDCVDLPKRMSDPPILTSFQAGWRDIQLAHYRNSWLNLPEISSPRHIVIIPIGHRTYDVELGAEGRSETVSYREPDFSVGCIQIIPANLPHSLRSISLVQTMECIHFYLEPTFLAQVAYESVNPDRVELLLAPKEADLLIHQIGLALNASLEEDGVGSRFYADTMATALAAHLLRHYATRNHQFRDYEDGLSQQQLKQVVEYIQTHLGENLSLTDIANQLGMSQYYFCHLFKRSTGVSPHQYLIHQRVEQAKRLLKQTERTVTAIALDCGFANQSHFAKYFRQYTGMNPNQFRKL
ncbi:helix-turn-helix transcriptional regulator [Thermocoleostomius sinensis]|uniref:AraC family transcriptional regulator n=1 Tax=Thermocoleostomius sinensis A174 TaxID=2016057 RepID=A0A9E8Z884_9CYAN|nr:AraC family transcriptional regulator [Thermocoleostomius sinensis]WAL58299.1 AraC family transcriptional regulator [Thermocoleostomius sinensis A174]